MDVDCEAADSLLFVAPTVAKDGFWRYITAFLRITGQKKNCGFHRPGTALSERLSMRNVVQIFILGYLPAVLCGCGSGKISDTSGSGFSLIDYLKDVPAVVRVENWDNPYGQGLVVETAHYRLFTTLADPLMLSQAPGFLESAYAAYQSQLPDPVGTGEPFKTYLFAQREQWEKFTKDFSPENANVYLQIQKGAYALKGVCVAYNIGRKQTFSVLGHEGWHQFNDRHFKYRLPSWLDEGIATLFETCRYDQGRFLFEPDRNLLRLGTLKQVLAEKRMIPLERLIALNPGQVLDGYGGDGDAATAFYAQTYALVRFLRENNYGQRLRNYHNLLLAGLRGNWPIDEPLARMAADRSVSLTVAWNHSVSPVLFKMYIDIDPEAIEKEYLSFCGKIVYHVQLKK